MTNASTLSTTSGTIQPALRQEQRIVHIPSYSYIALLSAALLEQHPRHIARPAVYPLLLSSKVSVDADVEHALAHPLFHTSTRR